MFKGTVKKKYQNIFDKYSIEDLKDLLQRELEKYMIIVKSSRIATAILNEYGLPFYEINEDYFKMVNALVHYCETKGINTLYDNEIEITLDDIITRINENRYAHLAQMDELAYMCDTFLYDDCYQINKNYIKEINDLYDAIIDRLKKERKIKVKRNEQIL